MRGAILVVSLPVDENVFTLVLRCHVFAESIIVLINDAVTILEVSHRSVPVLTITLDFADLADFALGACPFALPLQNVMAVASLLNEVGPAYLIREIAANVPHFTREPFISLFITDIPFFITHSVPGVRETTDVSYL